LQPEKLHPNTSTHKIDSYTVEAQRTLAGGELIDMIHAPLLSFSTTGKGLESARAFTAFQTSTDFRGRDAACYGRTEEQRGGSAVRLRERLPKKKEIAGQNDNKVQRLCRLTVMGSNSVYECRWRCDGQLGADGESKPSVIRRLGVSFLGHGQTNRRFDGRSGIKED